MDEQVMELFLALAASVATIGLAWLKQTMAKKGVSEDQADVLLDFVEEFADEMVEKYPGVTDLKAFNKHFKKLRRMWADEKVTTDDLLDYLEDLKE